MRGTNHVAALAVALVAAGAGVAAPPAVDFPAEVKATGDYVTVAPKTDAKGVSYVPLSGVDPFPAELLRDPKAFVLPVRGLPAGRYRFVGVASRDDEHTQFRFTVVVGDAPPVPPGPNPPDPIPPPAPVDPLKLKLRTAYDADAGQAAQKREWAKDLVVLYRRAAVLSADPSIGTAVQLRTKIGAAAKELLREATVKDALIGVRTVVAAELSALLPADADLTDDQRAAAAALFAKLATHLEAVTRE